MGIKKTLIFIYGMVRGIPVSTCVACVMPILLFVLLLWQEYTLVHKDTHQGDRSLNEQSRTEIQKFS